jgi:hypothetical protein
VNLGAQLPPGPRGQPAATNAGPGPCVLAATYTVPAHRHRPLDRTSKEVAKRRQQQWVGKLRHRVEALSPKVPADPPSHIYRRSSYLALEAFGELGGASSAGHVSSYEVLGPRAALHVLQYN